MLTKSIRLTEAEAAELREFLALTGEVEAALLKRAALRGLRAIRLERGIAAYLEGAGSAEAAAIAGLPRAHFLQVLVDRGIQILKGPSSLVSELEGLASQLGDERLARIGDRLGGFEK